MISGRVSGMSHSGAIVVPWPAAVNSAVAGTPNGHQTWWGWKSWPVFVTAAWTPGEDGWNWSPSSATVPTAPARAMRQPPFGAAMATGRMASTAHCLATMASTSRTEAQPVRPPRATRSAPTAQAVARRSSGWP